MTSPSICTEHVPQDDRRSLLSYAPSQARTGLAGLRSSSERNWSSQANFVRLEQGVGASELRKNAMLAYLAAGRLERLINIWIEELTEEEMRFGQ